MAATDLQPHHPHRSSPMNITHVLHPLLVRTGCGIPRRPRDLDDVHVVPLSVFASAAPYVPGFAPLGYEHCPDCLAWMRDPARFRDASFVSAAVNSYAPSVTAYPLTADGKPHPAGPNVAIGDYNRSGTPPTAEELPHRIAPALLNHWRAGGITRRNGMAFRIWHPVDHAVTGELDIQERPSTSAAADVRATAAAARRAYDSDEDIDPHVERMLSALDTAANMLDSMGKATA